MKHLIRCFAALVLASMSLMRLCAQDQSPGELAHNPIIWADVPDLAVIRVGDSY